MLSQELHLRKRIHLLIDTSIIALSFWLAYWVRSNTTVIFNQLGGGDTLFGFEHYFSAWLTVVLLTPFLLHFYGVYQRPLISSRKSIFLLLMKTTTLTSIGMVVALYLIRETLLVARGVVLLFWGISLVLLWIKEEIFLLMARNWFQKNQHIKRVILVGTQDSMFDVRQRLQAKLPFEISIAAELDFNRDGVDELVSGLHRHAANLVVFSPKKTPFNLVEKGIQCCEREGVECWLLGDFFNTQIAQLSIESFLGKPVMVFLSVPVSTWQSMGKHLIDWFGAIFLLILSSPFIVVSAIGIKLTSPGPILFRQKRSGLNGQPFTMFKFRSMVTNAEQLKAELAELNEMSGPVFKVTNDPRVTKIGRILRKTSIDELPQLFNVIRGEMSLVGPRPLPVDEVQRFDDHSYRRRLSVKPGLTCLWQISGRNQVNDFQDWVKLDLEYIDNWTLWLDIKILLRTIPVVILGVGAK